MSLSLTFKMKSLQNGRKQMGKFNFSVLCSRCFIFSSYLGDCIRATRSNTTEKAVPVRVRLYVVTKDKKGILQSNMINILMHLVVFYDLYFFLDLLIVLECIYCTQYLVHSVETPFIESGNTAGEFHNATAQPVVTLARRHRAVSESCAPPLPSPASPARTRPRTRPRTVH
jgi:hypothetical protein